MASCIFERYKVHLCDLLEVKPFNGNGVWGFAGGLGFGGCSFVCGFGFCLVFFGAGERGCEHRTTLERGKEPAN